MILFVLFSFVLVMPASAENVGIEFEKMPVGTTLVTESLGDSPRILEQKYIGKQGDYFVMEERQSKDDGTMRDLGQVFYDTQGRLVKSERKPGITYYTPYSCLFALGECTQVLDYPNPFTKKKVKRTKSTGHYNNRLEGDTFIVSWQLVDGSRQEVPYTLGPYKLRVSSKYKNRLNQVIGHKLIKIVQP